MSDKPKILIVATHPVQYQVPWFRYLHHHLSEYSIKVLYLTIPDSKTQGTGFATSFDWDTPLFDGYIWDRVDDRFVVHAGGIDSFFSLRLKQTKKMIANIRPRAVLLTGWQSFALLQILKACRQLKIPTLVRGDSNNLKPRTPIMKLIHRQLIKRYDSFLAVGKANKAFYIDNGVRESRIFNCPHFIDNAFFKQAVIDNDQVTGLRNNWNIPEAAFCFCYVGKLTPKKHVLNILSAHAKVNHHTRKPHLLIVGDGELMAEAGAYARKNKLAVSFTGFINQSEIPQVYAACDVLILASDYRETWGLVVNEAMACGLPAIVSNRCGCYPDLIENNHTGYLFEFNNIDDLSAKMMLFLDMPLKKYNDMCTQAQNRILEGYSIEKATKGLKEALNSL